MVAATAIAGQHDDAQSGEQRAQVRHHAQSAFVGKAEIEHDQIEGLLQHQPIQFASGSGAADAKAELAQPGNEDVLAQQRVVFQNGDG